MAGGPGVRKCRGVPQGLSLRSSARSFLCSSKNVPEDVPEAEVLPDGSGPGRARVCGLIGLWHSPASSRCHVEFSVVRTDRLGGHPWGCPSLADSGCVHWLQPGTVSWGRQGSAWSCPPPLFPSSAECRRSRDGGAAGGRGRRRRGVKGTPDRPPCCHHPRYRLRSRSPGAAGHWRWTSSARRAAGAAATATVRWCPTRV